MGSETTKINPAITTHFGTYFTRGRLAQAYPLLTQMWQLLDITIAMLVLYGMALHHRSYVGTPHHILALTTAGVMLFVYSWSDLYYRSRTRTLWLEAKYVLKAWGMVFLLLLAIGYISGTEHYFVRPFIVNWFCLAYLAQLLVHLAIRLSLHALRKWGFNTRQALLVGNGEALTGFAKLLSSNPWLGIQIIGTVRVEDIDPGSGTAEAADTCKSRDASYPLPSPSAFDNIPQLVSQFGVNEIYVALPRHEAELCGEVIKKLLGLPIKVNWVPDISVTRGIGGRMEYIEDQPVLCFNDSPLRGGRRLLKRLEDLIIASLLLTLLSPLLTAIAVWIKASSSGPVLFKQHRHGEHGRIITLWKFRTMFDQRGHADEHQAHPGDLRITPAGKFLRRWSLDELPQLFNVLQGSMSVVGPRPHPLWLDSRFESQIIAYMQRHRVKPGITGWAQVNGFRGETETVTKMEQRLRHDLYYINHWSPWLDLKILAMTTKAVFSGTNAY